MTEKKVLKINNRKNEIPPVNNGFNPNDNDMMGGFPTNQGSEFGDENLPLGDENQDLNNGMIDGGEDMMGGEEPRQDNGEENDPKKYIQQLTGKLSQSLREYNNESETPDTELNKYVAGMINKQIAKELDEKDVEEIIDKLKNDVNDGEDDLNVEDDNLDDMNNSDEFDNMEEFDNTTNEHVIHDTNITEITNNLLNANQRKDDNDIDKFNKSEITFSKKPFTSPTFK